MIKFSEIKNQVIYKIAKEAIFMSGSTESEIIDVLDEAFGGDGTWRCPKGEKAWNIACQAGFIEFVDHKTWVVTDAAMDFVESCEAARQSDCRDYESYTRLDELGKS